MRFQNTSLDRSHWNRWRSIQVVVLLVATLLPIRMLIETLCASEEPASEEPASEEPASEEPASEEPASEEPASEEPASEKPASDFFTIEVLDEANDRAIPLVKITTTSGLTWFTDNAGIVTIDAPELWGNEVWFHISSHGYEARKDGFGFRGVRLSPTRGGKKNLRLHRHLAAERVGRLTGSGLVAESQKLGRFTDWAESGVVGCDSVFATRWKGKLFWLWGDTNVYHYPLGIFKTLGATSDLKPLDLDRQPILPNFHFFRDEGGALKPIADIPAKGPVWLGGLVALRDAQGKEHLLASYSKIQNHLDVEEFGLCEWNEDDEVFRQVKTIWRRGIDAPPKAREVTIPDGHAVPYRDPLGADTVLFVNPSAQVQIPASYEAWLDPTTWRAIPRIRSLPDSHGEEIQLHRGDIAWSDRIKKWIMVFTQNHGKESPLGEIWCSTSDSPLDGWEVPTRIATHVNYTFYNPMIHTEWLSGESRWLHFEGTYTAEFADRAEKTPRYDYNQILYRIDLDELLRAPR